MDIDYIAAAQVLDRLTRLLANTPHGQREDIADDIIAFVKSMEEKYSTKK